MSEHNMKHFRRTWAHYDPEGTGFLNIVTLKRFLVRMESPLGIDMLTSADHKKIYNFLKSLDIETYDNYTKVFYYDVI